MNTLRDALLSKLEFDAVVDVKDIEGNNKKLDKLFEDVRSSLASRYSIVADKPGNRIYVQYKVR